MIIKLGDGVATINTQISSRHITRRVGQEVCHRAHQVLRLTHFPLRNQRRPVFIQVWVVVEDLLGPVMTLARAIVCGFWSDEVTTYRAVNM